jgi:hypothetical protein
MTRAYSFKYLGKILPLNTPLEVDCIQGWGFEWLFKAAKGAHKNIIGNNQFKFCLVQDNYQSIWSYAFYDVLYFVCITPKHKIVF